MQSCTGTRKHGESNAWCVGARDPGRDALDRETTTGSVPCSEGVLLQAQTAAKLPELDSLVDMNSASLKYHEAEVRELTAQKIQLQEIIRILHAGITHEDLKLVLSQVHIIGEASASASRQLILELGTMRSDVLKQAEVIAAKVTTQQAKFMKSLQDVLGKAAMDCEEIPTEGAGRLISCNGSETCETGVNTAVIAELKHQRNTLVELLPELVEVGLRRHEANRASSLQELSRWQPFTPRDMSSGISGRAVEMMSSTTLGGNGKVVEARAASSVLEAASPKMHTCPTGISTTPEVHSPASDARTRSPKETRATEEMRENTTSTPRARHSRDRRNLDFAQGANRVAVLRRKHRLQKAFEVNAEVESKEDRATPRISVRLAQNWGDKLAKADRRSIEKYLDQIVCFTIVLNTALIGFSVDATIDGGWGPWQVIDIIFALFFVMEFILKMILHGPKRHFVGHNPRTGQHRIEYLNMFDTFVVCFDSAQVILGIMNFGKSGTTRVATLFRLVRLIRILKMLRVLRAKVMKGLLDMLQGVVHGSLTLSWAMVLFVFAVYVLGVFARVVLGRDESFAFRSYFDSVPRSMLTIFRCSFGDCTSQDGTPIPEVINGQYGGAYSLAYCGFIFFITIGLFNTISAIFVESTVAAAADLAERKRLDRFNDPELYATSVAAIIRGLIAASDEPACQNVDLDDLVGFLDEIIRIEFDREFFDEAVLSDNNIIQALCRLDIDQQDHKRLSDIFDPDNSGTISMLELAEGLRQLRGAPSRSDIVTVDLMLRSLQDKVDDLIDVLESLRFRPQTPR